jgi:hypothetical protein
MSHEKFPTAATESADASEEKFESTSAIEERLDELGWTEEQLGGFISAIQTMANVMTRGNGGDPTGKMNFDLAITKDEEGREVAAVTIAGAGKGLDSEQISELIDTGKLFMNVFSEASPEFFADQNKVILRRKKDRAPETDLIG